MSEPKRKATKVSALGAGILHWSVLDDRLGTRGEAYAVTGPEGLVLIDPEPLSARALAELVRHGPVAAICLTIQSHQRSAWRYRAHFEVPVFAPRAAEGLEDEPDIWYEPEDVLPGGLRVLHAPGPCEASYAFLLEEPPGFLFLGDLLVRGDKGGFGFVPGEYMDAPELARESVKRLLEQRFDALCPGHGAPLLAGGREAVIAALRADGAL